MSLILEAGGRTMSKAIRVGWMAVCGIAALLATDTVCFAQGPTDNPYRPVRGLADGGGPSVPGGEWARLPGGREMGPPASVHVDIDGESIWAFIRCDETSPASAETTSIISGRRPVS
jgi:hypothetical protein